MCVIKRFIVMLLFVTFCLPPTLARPIEGKHQEAQAANTIAQDVTIIIQQEKVRVTTQKAVRADSGGPYQFVLSFGASRHNHR